MKIIVNEGLTNNEIGIPESILPDRETAIFELGQWKKEVLIKRLDTEDVHVSKDFFPYDIPLDLPYERKEKIETIKLGPVIAVIVPNRKREYAELCNYKKYMELYQQVNGLVFISSTNRIDFGKRVMRGYYYNPILKEIDPVERIFPFPDAVYKRCGSRKRRTFQMLSEMVNYKVFNWPNLNKMGQYRMFRNNESLFAHFPKTKRLRSINTVKGMLRDYPMIYLKPINGGKAKGIMALSKTGDSYIMTKESEKKELNNKELAMYIEQIKSNKQYIVQQAAPKVANKNIVLRAILQKNDVGEWVFSGGYTRIGIEGSDITNRIHTKEFMKLEDSFMKFYHMNDTEAKSFVELMVGTCKRICEGFDEAGINFGDLAFDLIVGPNLKIWIIEVNNRYHNHRSPLLTIQDREMYDRVISIPLLYAKYLAGF